MLSATFRLELTWLVAGSAIAVMVGFIIGWPGSLLAMYLAGYAVWTLYRLETIVRWLRSGAKNRTAPYSHGLTDEIVELVHREKKYSRKQKNRFRSALGRFNALAGNLPDAIVVLDRDNEIRWSNPAARQLLNIHPRRDLGQRINNLVRDPAFSDFLSNGNIDEEIEIAGPMTPEQTLVLRKVPNAKRMTVLIAADITQRVRVRNMRKAFVADVSHELRTPLTVIRGYLEMLQEYDNLPPDVMEALQEVSLQSDRMRGIVEDLLELSKLEASTLQENEGEPVAIAAMLKHMVSSLGNDASRHQFELRLDESMSLLGNERELYSACNNLLTNAIKYTGSGTTVTVRWEMNNEGMACLSVADDGPGIEPRHLSRLSERFYRVDSGRSRDQGGTGLGLAIVKHAVQRHGGTLHLESTPGSGSTFSALFPAERVHRLPEPLPLVPAPYERERKRPEILGAANNADR